MTNAAKIETKGTVTTKKPHQRRDVGMEQKAAGV
jgi:hypothetical protein